MFLYSCTHDSAHFWHLWVALRTGARCPSSIKRASALSHSLRVGRRAFTRATGSGDSPNLTDGVALAYASPCFRLVHPLKPVARSDRQRSEKEAEEGMQILRPRQKVMD